MPQMKFKKLTAQPDPSALIENEELGILHDPVSDTISMHMNRNGTILNTLKDKEVLEKNNTPNDTYINTYVSDNLIAESGTGNASGTFYVSDPLALDNTLGLTVRPGVVVEQGGYYQNNSSTYGGTRDPLSPVAIELVEHIRGPHNPRYGTAFTIGKFTLPSDISSFLSPLDIGGVIHASSVFVINRSNYVSAGAVWIKVLSGSCHQYATRINGEPQEGFNVDNVIYPADGWTHLQRTIVDVKSTIAQIYIRSSADTVFLLALPYASVTNNVIHPSQHRGPIF